MDRQRDENVFPRGMSVSAVFLLHKNISCMETFHLLQYTETSKHFISFCTKIRVTLIWILGWMCKKLLNLPVRI